jgi:hypothetical protein
MRFVGLLIYLSEYEGEYDFVTRAVAFGFNAYCPLASTRTYDFCYKSGLAPDNVFTGSLYLPKHRHPHSQLSA